MTAKCLKPERNCGRSGAVAQIAGTACAGRMDARCDPPGAARRARPSDPSLAEILGVRLLLVNVLRPLAAGQNSRPRRSTNCSTKSARPSTTSLESWPLRRKEIAMAMTKWGRKETIIWPPHSPIYTYGAVFMALVLYRTFSLLPVHLRQQPPTAVLHAHLHPVERCRSNRNEPPRQLPDAHGGRSRNSHRVWRRTPT